MWLDGWWMFGENAARQLDPFAAKLLGAWVEMPLLVVGFETLTLEELLLPLLLLGVVMCAHWILLRRR
jgi:hypothetical protein